MSRVHRVTHPVLGVATWREIQKAGDALRKQAGAGVCNWCHGPVPAGSRTRCDSEACADNIWRSYSWNHCRQVALREARLRCALCGQGAWEVDHIVPVSLGGTGDAANLRALCSPCHQHETRQLQRLKAGYRAQEQLQ